jgi:N-acetylneuraminate lyase
MKQLVGILPALLTPVDAQGNLNERALIALLDRLYQWPIHGVYVGGQTGEGLQLSVLTRKRLTELAVRHSPSGKAVIVHVGAMSLQDASELAAHASGAGAQAVSSLPPAGPFSFCEVREYYRQLAQSSPLPVIVYHFSEYSHAVSSAPQLLEICALSNIAGLKFTDYDLFSLDLLASRGIPIFYGRDELISAGLMYGATGGIGTFYNIAPGYFTEIYRLAQNGDWEASRMLERRVQTLIRACLRFPLHSAVKQIVTWQGIECGDALAPRAVLTPAQREELWEELAGSGFVEDLALSRDIPTKRHHAI